MTIRRMERWRTQQGREGGEGSQEANADGGSLWHLSDGPVELSPGLTETAL